MANPTALSKNRRLNYDNMALEVDQLIVNGVPVMISQQANVADPAAITAYSAATTAAPTAYAAADISATYVEAEVQAIADALETLRNEVATLTTANNAISAAAATLRSEVNGLRTTLVAALDLIEAAGIMADA